jgi:hypothetical protein
MDWHVEAKVSTDVDLLELEGGQSHALGISQ